MPAFAILRHDGPQGTHFDFLLEMGDALKTWSLPQPPESGLETIAEARPDHRLIYLDYQGPISGGRGTVSRWDGGTFEMLRQGRSELVLELAGERLRGRVLLKRTPENPSGWRFVFHAA